MCGIMFDMKPRIAVSRLPVVFWATIYEDSSNLDVRLSIPSNPVDPIQPRNDKDLKKSPVCSVGFPATASLAGPPKP